MFVWIGEKASPAECHNAMGYAHVSELLIMNTRFCLEFLFSSPEQRSGRAIVLSQALADANVKCFMSKFFGPHYFQTLSSIWFMFGIMIDIGPKFYRVLWASQYMTLKT